MCVWWWWWWAGRRGGVGVGGRLGPRKCSHSQAALSSSQANIDVKKGNYNAPMHVKGTGVAEIVRT